jgi:hypothetical protein
MRLSHLVLVPAVASALVWVACGVPISHIYAGDLYDPDADCLNPGTVIDPALVGPPVEAGACDAICITDLDGQVWISEQCPPYPEQYDLTGKSTACPHAFAAACRQCPIEAGERVMTICDAGVKDAPAPPPPAEAGDAPAAEAAKGGKKDGSGS